jgi:RecJ-like exonuclease
VCSGEQVLVCPDCQVDGWTAGLDTCATCGSTMLVKQLGVVSCRGCGTAAQPAGHEGATPGASGTASHDESLTTDVAAALDRVLRRPPADG